MTNQISRILFLGLCLLAITTLWRSSSIPTSQNMVLIVILFILISVLGLAWAFLAPRYNRGKMARFGDRKPLESDDFYEKFYADSGLPRALVLELLQEVGDSVEIVPTLLRPQDRILVELSDLKSLKPADGGLAEVTFAAQRRQKKLGVTVDITKIQTVDDYIRRFGALEVSTRNSVPPLGVS